MLALKVLSVCAPRLEADRLRVLTVLLELMRGRRPMDELSEVNMSSRIMASSSERSASSSRSNPSNSISEHRSKVDESKLTDGLGPGFPVPVEITPFCHEPTMRQVAALPSCEGCKPVLRMGSSSSNQPDGDDIAVTDNGNYIVDLHFDEPIKDPRKMAADLKNVCGVVDHGLFCDMSTAVIIAGSDGISVKK